jgi:hypothetical protein
MTEITIAGGVYYEQVQWPPWDLIFGSGGRAAASLVGHIDTIELRTYARSDTAEAFQRAADVYGFSFHPEAAEQSVCFQYVHTLSTPVIVPAPARIRPIAPFRVQADAVLRFGMMEGSALVEADRCVYDPQSPLNPEPFERNGSRAAHLAIVANRGEVGALTGVAGDPVAAAQRLLGDGAEVVVVKCGAAGAIVVEKSGTREISAYQSEGVWTLGSGDVFAAIFAAYWAVHGQSAADAAELASRAVASYADTKSLPIPAAEALRTAAAEPVKAQTGRVYLAGPFFSIGQRWLVDEARQYLFDMGMNVFSPLHDIGNGPAGTVAPADLAALDACDAVFALLDGLDSGTLFELGYARAKSKPVYALAQSVGDEDLKMVVGSGCRVYGDLVTALHHLVWRV